METKPREMLLQVALEDALRLLAAISYTSMAQKTQASRVGDLAQQCGCDVPVTIRDYSRRRTQGYINTGGGVSKWKKDKYGRGKF